ncbi:MAG: hypothetical protein EA426_17640 [Spirochaetaceae bacterium]|nr:MAG: hypothetical protein EA426_17640 [Spirochaetaceae bacterium]
MIRSEVITNRSVEDDLLEQFRELGLPNVYTKLTSVHGAGSSGERHGDHVWPEENVLILIYSDSAQGLAVREAVRRVKSVFPAAGIKLFQFEIDVVEL